MLIHCILPEWIQTLVSGIRQNYFREERGLLEDKFLLDGTTSEDWILDEQQLETDKNNKANYETASEHEESSEEKEEDESTHKEIHDLEAPRKNTRKRRPSKYLNEYKAIAYSAESIVDDVPDSLKEMTQRQKGRMEACNSGRAQCVRKI